MHLLQLDDIKVGERQRKEIKRTPLKELKDSIRENGLLHPIVVALNPAEGTERHILIAGGRRLEAIRELYNEGVKTTQVGKLVPGPSIYANILTVRDLAEQLTLEYEENAVRADLDWAETQEAIAAIHRAMQARDSSHTQADTAKVLQSAAGGAQAISQSQANKQVTRALTIVAALDRPDIRKAASANEAYQALLKESHNRFEAELARRKLLKARSSERLWDLKQGDLRNVLVEMEDGTVDLILCDPPYGLGDAKDKADSSRNFHRYEDNESYAVELSIFIIQEGWRLTKSKANLFLFCTWKSFPLLQEAAAKYGWSPWSGPIVWQKSAEGEAPWGRLGFVKTHEVFLYATKGQKGISGPLPDVLSFQKLGTKGRDHAAEKPQSLLTKLIEVSTLPHDLVLDPCAGSGSTLEASVRTSRRAKGVELDEHYFNGAMARLSRVENEIAEQKNTSDPKVGVL